MALRTDRIVLEGARDMLDQKDIEIIGKLLDAKLDAKLQPMQEDIAQLKEDVAEIRSATNIMLDWAVSVREHLGQSVPDFRV